MSFNPSFSAINFEVRYTVTLLLVLAGNKKKQCARVAAQARVATFLANGFPHAVQSVVSTVCVRMNVSIPVDPHPLPWPVVDEDSGRRPQES